MSPPAGPAELAADTFCRVIDEGTGDTLSPSPTTLTSIFSAARVHISIRLPYFLPGAGMVSALQSASLRGVTVQIVLPERSNLRFVDWATRNMLWELLL